MNSQKAKGAKSSQKKSSKSEKAAGKSKLKKVSVATSRNEKTGAPEVSGSAYSGDGRVRVRHREYVADVVGSALYASTDYQINPGNPALFPWLSQMAMRYESYVFKKLIFEYETQVSSATSGSVMLAVDFDAADDPPDTKQQLMAYHNAVRSAAWSECIYSCSDQDLRKFGVQRYVSNGSFNGDIKTYNVGQLFVATQNCPASAVGELYVSYDIELMTPQMESFSDSIPSAHIVTTAVARATPFTGVQTVTGGLPVTATSNVLTFNVIGNFLIAIDFVGTVFTDTEPTLGGTVNASNQPWGAFLHNAAATEACAFVLVTVTNVGQTLTFSLVASATTVTSSDVRVSYYNAP